MCSSDLCGPAVRGGAIRPIGWDRPGFWRSHPGRVHRLGTSVAVALITVYGSRRATRPAVSKRYPMRFVASPLLVAVALGFLAPSVLDTEDEDQEEVLPQPDAAPVIDIAVNSEAS